MKRILRVATIITVASGCQPGNPVTNSNSTPKPPAPAPSVSAGISSGQGSFQKYKFEYRKEGDRVVALFLSPKLPRNDKILNGAVREVVTAAFKEQVYGEPELIPWKYGEQSVNGARYRGVTNWFVVVPIKEDTGETHSLVVWKVAQ